jgi:hypothetical protein
MVEEMSSTLLRIVSCSPKCGTIEEFIRMARLLSEVPESSEGTLASEVGLDPQVVKGAVKVCRYALMAMDDLRLRNQRPTVQNLMTMSREYKTASLEDGVAEVRKFQMAMGALAILDGIGVKGR